MLLERLGRPIHDLGLPIEAQIEEIAATLARGWHRPPSSSRWRTGAEQAEFLDRFIGEAWERLDGPCPEAVVRLAQECTRRRLASFDETTAVAIHGDAHPWNVLESPTGGFKLIDPDGLLSEPAHDLAIPLRHWNAELLEGDPAARLRSWCAHLQETTHVDAQAIFEWTYAEARVHRSVPPPSRRSAGQRLHRSRDSPRRVRVFARWMRRPRALSWCRTTPPRRSSLLPATST